MKQVKQGLVPKLRFREFGGDGDWEEKKLRDVTSAIFDGTHQTPTYTSKGIPFYSVENLISRNKNKFISHEDYLIATSKNKPSRGDILLTRIGKIGYSKVVTWDFEFSVYVTLAVIKKSESFNSLYLHFFMQSERYQNEIFKKSLLNAVPCKINMDSLRDTRVLLPKITEQQKIADCLSSLDELIEAEDQKLEALQRHKKGLMQELFPSEGQTLPKRRFPEFQSAPEWEETLLGNHCTITTGKLDANAMVENGQYRFYTCAKDYYLIDKYAFDTDALLVSGNGANVGYIHYYKGKFNAYQRTYVLDQLTQDIFFIKYYLEKNLHKRIATEKKEGNTPYIVMSTLTDMIIILPKNKKEQQKIADCLSSIDDSITSQTKKLESLRLHKKGLMQQLFPNHNQEEIINHNKP